MNNNVIVEVSGIRLEEDSETPIMLLHEPETSRFLPIWIGTIEAVSIAYAQEGYVHPRPQTHPESVTAWHVALGAFFDFFVTVLFTLGITSSSSIILVL